MGRARQSRTGRRRRTGCGSPSTRPSSSGWARTLRSGTSPYWRQTQWSHCSHKLFKISFAVKINTESISVVERRSVDIFIKSLEYVRPSADSCPFATTTTKKATESAASAASTAAIGGCWPRHGRDKESRGHLKGG